MSNRVLILGAEWVSNCVPFVAKFRKTQFTAVNDGALRAMRLSDSQDNSLSILEVRSATQK
jgi:hypothetical protein